MLLKQRSVSSQRLINPSSQKTTMNVNNIISLSTNKAPSSSPSDNAKISLSTTIIVVTLYVLSGCSQPLMMTLLRRIGVADPSCQLYMLFYYFGPAAAIFTIPRASSSSSGSTITTTSWPSFKTISKACCIAIFDIAAQTMNYTGASLAGPTIFAIVYSSVTIWAALYSQVFLGRTMDTMQWMGVVGVFGGLASTATDSLTLGPGVMHGLILVTIGSSMHGLFYVMSEAVMTVGTEQLTVQQNCAVQGMTASASFLLWQVIYTAPRFDGKIWEPMEEAGTTLWMGLALLVIFGIISFVHSMSFYHTLRHLPGGSTSAGVFKGLQAVLVFVLTDWVYCGRIGGEEMCFTRSKFISLAAVSGGVIWYGIATNNRRDEKGPKPLVKGYERISEEEVDDNNSAEGIEIEAM